MFEEDLRFGSGWVLEHCMNRALVFGKVVVAVLELSRQEEQHWHPAWRATTSEIRASLYTSGNISTDLLYFPSLFQTIIDRLQYFQFIF